MRDLVLLGPDWAPLIFGNSHVPHVMIGSALPQPCSSHCCPRFIFRNPACGRKPLPSSVQVTPWIKSCKGLNNCCLPCFCIPWAACEYNTRHMLELLILPTHALHGSEPPGMSRVPKDRLGMRIQVEQRWDSRHPGFRGYLCLSSPLAPNGESPSGGPVQKPCTIYLVCTVTVNYGLHGPSGIKP